MDIIDKTEQKYGQFGFAVFITALILSGVLAFLFWIALLAFYPGIGVSIPPAIAAYIAWSAYR